MKAACHILATACYVLPIAWLNAAESPGAIEGRVRFSGPIPTSSVADDSGWRDPLIAVDPNTKGVRDVVVYLKIPARAPEAGRKLQPVKIDQVNNRFVPRVLAVQAGQAVIFTNSDAGNHNVRATAAVSTNEFNIFTGVEGSYQRTFAAMTNGRPIQIGCDIHPWMRAWIYVFDHPCFAVTNDEGKFSMRGVPAGNYEAVIAQPDIGYIETRRVSIRPGEVVSLNAEARVRNAR